MGRQTGAGPIAGSRSASSPERALSSRIRPGAGAARRLAEQRGEGGTRGRWVANGDGIVPIRRTLADHDESRPSRPRSRNGISPRTVPAGRAGPRAPRPSGRATVPRPRVACRPRISRRASASSGWNRTMSPGAANSRAGSKRNRPLAVLGHQPHQMLGRCRRRARERGATSKGERKQRGRDSPSGRLSTIPASPSPRGISLFADVIPNRDAGEARLGGATSHRRARWMLAAVNRGSSRSAHQYGRGLMQRLEPAGKGQGSSSCWLVVTQGRY